jgi:hypothetical protein
MWIHRVDPLVTSERKDFWQRDTRLEKSGKPTLEECRQVAMALKTPSAGCVEVLFWFVS